MNTSQKYIAIKVKGVEHWLWFETAKISFTDDKFFGHGGWGEGGAFSEIEVNMDLIEGHIACESPQYT